MCPCGGVSSWIGFEEGGDGGSVCRGENDAFAVEESGACHSCWLVLQSPELKLQNDVEVVLQLYSDF